MTQPRRQSPPTPVREVRRDETPIDLVFGGQAADFPARDREARRIVQLVTHGTSVEVVGGRWSGRSEVLRTVHRSLTVLGLNVLAVTGTGSPLPLEAVRVSLPSGYRKATSESGGTAAGIGDALFHYLGDGPSVVIVDDSDLLDDESWTLLVSAYRQLGRAVVSSTVRRPPHGSTVKRLVDVAHPVVQVSLDELRLETLHAVLEGRVDGSLSPAVSARIHTKSAGIPGLAVSMLDGAVAQGLVRRSGHHWVGGPVLWSDDVRGTFESLLAPYSPRLRDAVELLSVTGTVELGHAWNLLGRELVEDLESHDLVRLSSVGEDRAPVLGVHPPGVGDYFLHQPLSARRQRIVDDAIARLGAQGEVGAVAPATLLARLRSTGPALSGTADRTVPLAQGDVAVVSRMFTESCRVSLAAARAAWTETDDPREALRYLRLHLTSRGDAEEIERVLDAVSGVAVEDPEVEVGLRYARSRWLVAQGASVDDAVRPLLEGLPEGFAHAEALDTLARGTRWEHEEIDATYASVLEPRAAGDGLDAQVAAVLLAACHTMSGRAPDALTVLDAIVGDLPEVERVGAELVRGLALYSTGRFEEVAALAAEQVRRATWSLDRIAFAGYSYLGALAQIALGRPEEAQGALAIVLSSGIVPRLIPFAPVRAVLVAMSVIDSRTGHVAAAASVVEHADEVLGATDALPMGSTAWAEAAAAAAAGDHEGAAATFTGLAAALRHRGYTLAADTATMASLTVHFEPGLAAGFRARAEELGGGLYVASLDARKATYEQDPESLESAARDLQRHGAREEALRSFTIAARLYRDEGKAGRAADARSAARAVTEEIGAAGHVVSGGTDLGFTSREIDIIRLVAEGQSNNEIAESLVLSTRTVESHMRNIRRKSGAAEREDIASFGRTI